jgi:hypothetical protein
MLSSVEFPSEPVPMIHLVCLVVPVVVALGAPASAQPPADRVPITIAVEHVHKSGSCKGELTVDKWLFTYRSTDRPEDNRDWKLTELKAAESKNPAELTLKTRESGKVSGLDKSYRFRVPGGLDRALLDYMNDRID